jgi:hypothetical protein
MIRKEVYNQHPFGILEVGRASLGEFDHSPILPDYLRNSLLALGFALLPLSLADYLLNHFVYQPFSFAVNFL